MSFKDQPYEDQSYDHELELIAALDEEMQVLAKEVETLNQKIEALAWQRNARREARLEENNRFIGLLNS